MHALSSSCRSSLGEVVGPALLLCPIGAVSLGVDLELLLICVDDFLSTVLALGA